MSAEGELDGYGARFKPLGARFIGRFVEAFPRFTRRFGLAR